MGPLDSVLGEYLTKQNEKGYEDFKNRPYLTYRYNLMKHIGHISVRNNAEYGKNEKREGVLCYPLCYYPIQYVGLMNYENFSDKCLNGIKY